MKLRILAGAVLLAAAMLAAAALWLFGSEAGLRWAVARLEAAAAGKLRIERPRGALASGVFADRVIFEADGTKLEAERFGARLRVLALLSARLEIDPLSIDRLSLAFAASGEKAAAAPRLPVGLRIGEARIGRLELAGSGTPLALRDVQIAHFELGSLQRLSGAARFNVEDRRFAAAMTLELGGTLEHVQAMLGGELRGARAELKASLAPFQAQQVESLELRASGIDLAKFHDAAPNTALTIAIQARGVREGFAGTLSLGNAAPGPIDAGRVPIASARAHFATAALKSVSFDQARIALVGGGVLQGGGELAAARATATLQAQAVDLRALQSTLRRTSLDGWLHAVVSPETQMLRASLSEQGIALSAEAVRRGDTIDINALHAEANGGELSGSGAVRLGPPLAFEGRLQLAKFDPSAFGDYPEGAVNGTLDVAGRLGDAPQADLRWAIADSVLYDLPLETSGRARVATRRVSDAQAKVKLGEMQLEASGGFGASGDALQLSLDVPEISELAAEVAGRLRARATLRGTWQAPQAELTAQAEALQAGGIVVERASARFAGSAARHGLSLTAHAYDADLVAELRGGLEGKLWRGELVSLASSGAVQLQTVAPTTLVISRGRTELGRLELTLAKGRVLVRQLVKSGERLSSSGEFTGVPTGWLVAAAGLADRVRSTLLLDGDWTVAAGPGVEGTLRVRRAQGDVSVLGERTLDLGLQAVALDARFTSSGVAARMDVDARLLSAALGGQIGHAPGAGALGIAAASPILLEGNVELASLGVLAGPYVRQGRVDGKLSADLRATGTLGAPAFSATLRGEALSLDLPPYGVYLRDGALVAQLENDVLQVRQLSVRGGQGTFSAKGSLPMRLADGNAKLAWQADHLTVLDRQEMRLAASGNGEVGFDGKKLALTGELRADRGSIEYAADRLPSLADDIVIEGEPRRRVGEAKTALPIQLNLDLDLGENLTVAMRGFDGKLAGRVNLRTTDQGELRAYGEVRAVAATFFAYGKRLRVDPGVVTFDGPIDNPGLQITAWRRNQAVEAGIQISGTVRAPRVQLVSQPPVPEQERLTWLVLGRAPADTTRADLGLLQAAAGALLARGDVTSMPLDQRLAKTFGLDEISLRSSSTTTTSPTTGTSDVEGAVVAFGKRVSDKIYVSYEQGLGTVASNLVKLDYSISRRWSVRAETGTSSGGGLFYRFSWD